MIEEKWTDEDRILYEVIRHPSLCGEFLKNLDLESYEDPWEYTYYQHEFMCDFSHYISLCCARAVGKTESIVGIIEWTLVNKIFPGDYIVYNVPNKAHLDPVWDNLTRSFRVNSLLKQYIDSRRGINSSEHSIKLFNNTSLLCRIAGTTGTGVNVVGLHSPFEVIDENGLYPWGTWIELQPTQNVWQDGFRLITAGVPTGLRERNVCFYADELDSKYSHHRISAHQNPRYTEEREHDNVEQYGGIDSEDYIHHVLGRHGTPTFAIFDRNLMKFEEYPVFKLTLNGLKIADDSEYYNKLATLPAIGVKFDYTLVGIDLGYTEPTAIHIMYAKNGKLYYHARVELTKVPYPVQKRLIDFLDDKFNRFDIIGVDSGGPGKPVVQDLLDADVFIHKDYKKRLVPVDFASWIVLGINADGDEIRTKMKPFSVSVAQEYTNSHKLIYSTTDLEFVAELERTTYSKTPSGEIVYRTLTPRGGSRGDDHHTAALLCAMVGQYIMKDAINNKPKAKRLFTPKWLGRV